MRSLCMIFAMVFVAGCGTQGIKNRLDPPDLHRTGIESDFVEFERRESEAITNSSPDTLRDYVQAGFTLSDASCRSWLRLLEHSDRQVEFSRDIFNIVGNAFLGIAGINGASAASLARASIVMSGVNAGVDTYKAEIIQGVIPEVRKLLFEAKYQAQKGFFSDPPKSVLEAKRRLRIYHDLCSASEIRKLLNDGLRQVKYELPTEAFLQPEMARQGVDLYRTLFPGKDGAFSDEELFELWALAVKALPENKESAFTTSIHASNFLGSTKTTIDKNPEAQRILRNLARVANFAAKLQQVLTNEAEIKRGKEVSSRAEGGVKEASKPETKSPAAAANTTATPEEKARSIVEKEMQKDRALRNNAEMRQAVASLPENNKLRVSVETYLKSIAAEHGGAPRSRQSRDIPVIVPIRSGL